MGYKAHIKNIDNSVHSNVQRFHPYFYAKQNISVKFCDLSCSYSGEEVNNVTASERPWQPCSEKNQHLIGSIDEHF